MLVPYAQICSAFALSRRPTPGVRQPESPRSRSMRQSLSVMRLETSPIAMPSPPGFRTKTRSKRHLSDRANELDSGAGPGISGDGHLADRQPTHAVAFRSARDERGTAVGARVDDLCGIRAGTEKRQVLMSSRAFDEDGRGHAVVAGREVHRSAGGRGALDPETTCLGERIDRSLNRCGVVMISVADRAERRGFDVDVRRRTGTGCGGFTRRTFDS